MAEWDRAISDFKRAIELGADIVSSFKNDYTDVGDFESQNNKIVPEELAELLGGR